MYRFVGREPLIKGIGDLDRAVIDTDVTAGALVFDNIAWLFDQTDREIARFSADALNFGIGNNFDIGMARTFNKFGRFNTHGAVIGGEGLVQQRHFAADRGRFIDQKHPETRIRQIERSLNAADTATDDENIATVAIDGMICREKFD